MTGASVAVALRRALEAGAFDGLRDVYAEDAALDASLPGARHRHRGRAAVVEALGAWWPGPGRLAEWSAREHPGGLDLWAERVGPEGASRTRQYLRLDGAGAIERHWIYAAPPRSLQAAGRPEAGTRLDPRLLADLGEVVEQAPVDSRGWSGNALERVRLADGRRLIAKRIVPGANWIDRHTRDEGREGLLFTSGVLGRLPARVDPAIVAARRAGDGWWVVMEDVSGLLLPDDARLSRAQSHAVLEAANLMWEEFWGERVPHLCSLEDCFRLFAPAIAEAERGGLDLLPKQYEAFWEAFAEAAPADVADGVLALLADPGPLVLALERCGTTMIHADIRDEQIGLDGDRLILLDWGRATQGHPVVDFAWSLCHNAWRIDAGKDDLVADFRRVRGEHDDPAANDFIGLVGLLMYGWIFGHSAAYHPDAAERAWAREELAWWVPRARRGLAAL